MGKIDIKGDIVSDDAGAFYEYFGMSSTYLNWYKKPSLTMKMKKSHLILLQMVVMCLR